MPITPTNPLKSTVTPSGSVKAGVYMWGDSLATWGDVLATWGGISSVMVNATKSNISSVYLLTESSDFLITESGDRLIFASGGNITNQPKS